MISIDDRGGLQRKLLAIGACLLAIGAAATPSTIPYTVDAEVWFVQGASTVVSPGMMPSEADVRNASAEIQAARRLVASGEFYGDSGFEQYLQSVGRALDIYDVSQQRGSAMLQLAASLAMARRFFQDSADTVAKWTKIAGHIYPDEHFVRIPERFIKRGELDVAQEPALSPGDIAAWLDLDAAAI